MILSSFMMRLARNTMESSDQPCPHGKSQMDVDEEEYREEDDDDDDDDDDDGGGDQDDDEDYDEE